MLISSLFKRQPDYRRQAAALYSQLVSQARHPWFYTEAGVPDTLDGRFEMIVLHLHAMQKRLKSEPELAQVLLEIAFDDLDRSLRELGVGDMGVARRIRAMADGIYGRFEAYDRALGEEGALAEALRRNVYGTVKAPKEPIDLLCYYISTLHKLPAAEITQWPVLPPLPSA